MVLTHMMVKRELNPLFWFLGLPLAVGYGWVWLNALYGTPIAHVAIAIGVADILIGIGPALKEGAWNRRMVRKIEDGSSMRKMADDAAAVPFERFNKSLFDWWFRDILAAHPNEIRTITSGTLKEHKAQKLNYVGFPLQTNDDSILVVTANRIAKLNPSGCLLEEDLDRTNQGQPIPEAFLVEQVGNPQLRLEPKGIDLKGDIRELFTTDTLAKSNVLSEDQSARQEVWVYRALYNANEHGITMEMRSLALKDHPLTELIKLSPEKNLNQKRLDAMRFMLSVGFKVMDINKWGLVDKALVGLFNHYKAVGIVVTRAGDGQPGFVEPTIEPVLIDRDQLKALNDRAGQ